MGEAGDSDPQDMQDHERQGDIGERAVQFADGGISALGAFRADGGRPSFSSAWPAFTTIAPPAASGPLPLRHKR